MGILSRFKDILSANVNAILDKAEDPVKMIDQYLENAMNDFAEVKEETAAVLAEEKRCKRLLVSNQEDIKKYETLAQKAVLAGNDGDAKVFLAEKQVLEANEDRYQKAYAAARANAEKMRQLHDKLAADIQSLQNRRAGIKATMAVANTQKTVNKAIGSYGEASGSLAGFAKMEEKAQRMLDEAAALSELNENAGSEEVSALEEKYSAAGSQSVDEELARMKAGLGV